MYQHQDPLNKIYGKLLCEGSLKDYRDLERDKSGVVMDTIFEPGMHVVELDRVVLDNNVELPAEVEFTATFEPADYQPGSDSAYKTQDAGYTIEINKVEVPLALSQQDIDELSGMPGKYTPGMNLLLLFNPNDIQNIKDLVSTYFNSKGNS